ncbi:MAG: two-component system, OmpR family, alkaline phosphatase synthesis response regulator PhoP [Candidatus Cloacimonadota bacterium]|nr:two-component system, OmpR family, alkaline phosphatase synthesis response regulator PhoP [Candidatus Cloacimonadota bacterium]
MKKLIYIVDDEPDILALVELTLVKAGFEIQAFDKAKPLLAALKQQVPQLLVLDLMLPDADGIEICRQLRRDKRYQNMPIVMLTAKVGIEDRVTGLEEGADDYILKPFAAKELVARIQAVLRRLSWQSEERVYEIAKGLVLDLNKFEASLNGKRLDLTLTEFKLLQLLTKRPGWVYTRAQMLDYLWGNDKIVIDRTIDVHIKNLRDKIRPYDQYIKPVRGIGYKYLPEEEA